MGQSHPFNPQTGRVLHQEIQYHGMQVQVQVSVHMVEPQASVTESSDLFVQFRTELRTQRSLEEETKAAGHGSAAELTIGIDEAGDSLEGKRRPPYQ